MRPLSVFLLALGSRLWLLSWMPAGYTGDESVDTCQLPQGMLGWNEAAGGTSYLAFLVSLGAYWTFGVSPRVARLLVMTLFASAVTLVDVAMMRLTNGKVAGFTTAALLLSPALVIHSVYATLIPWGFFVSAVTWWSLAQPPLRAWLFGPILLTGLFTYAGGALTSGSLIVSSRLCQRARWSPASTRAAAVSIGLAALVTWVIRRLVGQTPITQWAADDVGLSHWVDGVAVIIGGMFWGVPSWDAVIERTGWFPLLLLPLVAVSVLARHRRSAVMAIGGFVGTVMLASLGGSFPGVRRAIGGLMLLIIAAGLGYAELDRRWPRLAACGAWLLVGVLGYQAWQSHQHWNLPSYGFADASCASLRARFHPAAAGPRNESG